MVLDILFIQVPQKMYCDLQKVYWWDGFKKDIAEFVARFPNFQQVKVVHQRLGGLIQLMYVPTWKWEYINMDLIVGLPQTQRQTDSIWVIVYILTKFTHFILIQYTYFVEDY